MPEDVALDSNVFDRVAEREETIELVQRLTDAEELGLIVTHVQEDELAMIEDPVKRERIARIPRTVVPTYGFVVGRSRLGRARLSDGEGIEEIRGSNWPSS